VSLSLGGKSDFSVRGEFQAFQSIASFGEAGFFFFGGFDDFVLGELRFDGGNGAAVGAGDDQDDLAEAGAGVMGGEFGRRFERFKKGGVGAYTHIKRMVC